MSEILVVLQCLTPCLDPTTFHRLVLIVTAMVTMTGRVTMLGLSRWTEQGGSYRTIQRFFATKISWLQLNWYLIRHQFHDPEEVMILGGDETVVTKSGRETYGLGKFFSSIFGKPVSGIAVFPLSLISTTTRRSFPVFPRQIVKSQPEDAGASSSNGRSNGNGNGNGNGRPKGSKNRNRADVEFSPYLLGIQEMVRTVQAMIGPALPLMYMALDGAFGHNYALQMVRRCGLHLISKLQANSALYFPYTGPYSGRGPRRKYGDKLTYDRLPAQYLPHRSTHDDLRTDIYHIPQRVAQTVSAIAECRHHGQNPSQNPCLGPCHSV